MSHAPALVLGGTGKIGEAVLRGLAAKGAPTVFTYRSAEERALALAEELGARAARLDLEDTRTVRAFFQKLAPADAPASLIHCAGINQSRALSEITGEDWERMLAVNARSAWVACQEVVPLMEKQGGGDIVFLGAFDGTQVVPAPAHFAASQGALVGMTRSLARELGPKNIKVNLVALGVLGEGISQEMDPKLLADYQYFSALRRIGTAEEAARAILWVARQNSYMTGKVLSVNGGI